jgi:hypothetical protein
MERDGETAGQSRASTPRAERARRQVRPTSAALAGLLALALGLAACGGEDGDGGQAEQRSDTDYARAIEAAQTVSAADFPSARGRTLQQIAARVRQVQGGLATSVFTPGVNRLAFGVIGNDNKFVYGKSAVYLAPTPQALAQGPFPAPADPLVVDPPFRSKGAALESDAIAAIYEARVRLPKPGRYAVLLATKTRSGLVGAPAQIQVRRSSGIPQVGERPPDIETDTVASAGGDIESIETRVPPDEMHEVSFKDVVGKQPVALLFATPALCQTRVCGPVTDIAAQMQKEYGDEMAFIHQEVYEDNTVAKGLREQLRAFGLRTEPWLFTFDRDGRVAARLEGSFGNGAFERSIKAALDQ